MGFYQLFVEIQRVHVQRDEGGIVAHFWVPVREHGVKVPTRQLSLQIQSEANSDLDASSVGQLLFQKQWRDTTRRETTVG